MLFETDVLLTVCSVQPSERKGRYLCNLFHTAERSLCILKTFTYEFKTFCVNLKHLCTPLKHVCILHLKHMCTRLKHLYTPLKHSRIHLKHSHILAPSKTDA